MIGKGKYGKVYYAIKRSNNKEEFAVKAFCKESIMKSHEGKWGINNELSILRSLKH